MIHLRHLQSIPRLASLSSLFAACLLFPGSPAAAKDETPPSQDLQLKVVSFNIRYLTTRDKGINHWDLRKERTMAALRHFDADIIGMQEAFLSQVRDMQPALTDYQRIGVGREDGAEAGESCSIFFLKDRFELVEHGTFWLSDTPEMVASASWGNTVVRICTWALLNDKSLNRRFYVFNSHFDHRAQQSREQAARLIAKRITERSDKDTPFMLLGDLNAAEDNPAIRYLKGEPVTLAGGEGKETSPVKMIDSFRALNPDVREVATGHAFTGRTEGGKIDYVLVPQGTQVKASAIDYFKHENRFPSDHYPVTATLIFPNG